jgi:hypothetical protein
LAAASTKPTQEPTPERHWARPKTPAKGDPNPDMTFVSVGRALTAWEQIESALAFLFMVFSEASAANTAVIVGRTYGVIGFNPGRRLAIQTAAEIYFGHYWGYAKTELNRLLSHVQHASERRDEIAHGQVGSFMVNNVAVGSFLIPPDYNTRLFTPYVMPQINDDPLSFTRAKYKYTSIEIHSIVAKFHDLRNRINNYTNKYAKTQGKFAQDVNAVFQHYIEHRKY